MRINTDFSVAKYMLELLESESYRTKEMFDIKVDLMSKCDGFLEMIQFYDGVFSYDEYKEILFLALNGITYISDNETLKMLYENLKRIKLNSHLVKKKITSIRAFDFESMLHKLESTLPSKTEIDLNLYFVFDGINAASIYGEDSILINTMFWPSDKENEALIIDVLLHEYHHIGLKYWLRQYGYSNEKRYDNSNEFINYMTSSIIGEGAATYFFTDSNNLYPLILESHGEIVAENFKASVENREENINELINTLNSDLLEVVSDPKSAVELADLASKYSFDPSGREPLDKTIGYFMCKRIDEKLGRDQLIDCFKDMKGFYEKFNATVNNQTDVKFSTILYGGYHE